MKKKVFIGIAMSLFAVATVININLVKQSNTGDFTLQSIIGLAKADGESGGNPCQSHCQNAPGTCTFMYDGMPFCCDGWKK
jgi:hypothetical protein